MDNNFQKAAEKDSVGSLLLGAIFGGLTSEAGQMIDNIADAAEVASELHTHYHQKAAKNNNFQLGAKNAIGGAFARGVSNMLEKPDIQKRYLNFDYKMQPGMGMAMAA